MRSNASRTLQKLHVRWANHYFCVDLLFPCDSLGSSLWSGQCAAFKFQCLFVQSRTACTPFCLFLINNRKSSFGSVSSCICNGQNVLCNILEWNGIIFWGRSRSSGHFGKVWCSQIGECLWSLWFHWLAGKSQLYFWSPLKAVLLIYGFWRPAFLLL